MVWSAVAATLAATLLCAWGFGLAPIPWPEIALIWGYSLAWSFQTDWAKRAVYRHLGHNAPCHVCLIGLLKRSTVRGVPCTRNVRCVPGIPAPTLPVRVHGAGLSDSGTFGGSAGRTGVKRCRCGACASQCPSLDRPRGRAPMNQD